MNDDQLLASGVPLADKLLRTVVVYLGIALALRLAGSATWPSSTPSTWS